MFDEASCETLKFFGALLGFIIGVGTALGLVAMMILQSF
jgi:hypothetical protein